MAADSAQLPPAPDRRIAILAWSIAAVSFVLIALTGILYAVVLGAGVQAAIDALRPGPLSVVVVMPPVAIIGALVASRRPGNVIGWLILSISLTAMNPVFEYYAILALLVRPGQLPGGEAAAVFSSVNGLHGLAVMLLLLFIFPAGRPLTSRWRLVTWLATAAIPLFWLRIYAPGPLWNLPFLINPLGAEGIGGVWFLASIIVLILLPVSVLALAMRYRRSSVDERHQLKWVAAGPGLLFPLALGTTLVFCTARECGTSIPFYLEWLWGAAFFSIPLTVGIAILRYRLYDIDFLINRTILYGMVTAVLAIVFVGISAILERMAQTVSGRSSDIVNLVTVGIVAVSFGPVRARVRPFVDRLLPPRAMLTFLFTDIVGSTALAVELGDAAWRELLEHYRVAVRREIARAGGREIDTAGDGFFAIFDQPAGAVRCALLLTGAVRELGLGLRTGLHRGECEVRGEKVTGLAVHTAARVMALADAGDVLVTKAVHDATTATGLRFSSRGTHDLKGIPGSWPLEAVALP